ncbi:MAG: hypothetical protein KGH64_00065 [Candidatus Micrarchaeota archaeon]|nr:hypothetical protein [Candidatus Micrarchaeota archaeon]MDE1859761.1 hypothetical protein [Candidatus Micrarchaeota archaeon]
MVARKQVQNTVQVQESARRPFGWELELREGINRFYDSRYSATVPAMSRAVNNIIYGLAMLRRGDVEEAKLFLNKAKDVLSAGKEEIDKGITEPLGKLLENIDDVSNRFPVYKTNRDLDDVLVRILRPGQAEKLFAELDAEARSSDLFRDASKEAVRH